MTNTVFEEATKEVTKWTSIFTKATADFIRSIPVSADDLKENFEKLKAVLAEENEKTVEMWKTYHKSMTGQATKEDLDSANKHAHDLIKAAGLTFLLVLPGTIFFLPYIIHLAKERGVDIVPDSYKKMFQPKTRASKKEQQ